jgi:dienelactone hydrolase
MTDSSVLDGFTAHSFTADGKTKAVYRIGSGPAVIVIHEVPGLTPRVAAFARLVADAGFSVSCPILLGTPGKEVSKGYLLQQAAKLCVSLEFNASAAGKSSPVVAWLRELAVSEHARCGGPGVGTVGMCFSGGFALAMATEPVVIAPVMSQPSLPITLPWRKGNGAAIDCSTNEISAIKERMHADDALCVLGFRFSQDSLVPEDRFTTLRQQLGDRFHGVTFDSSSDNTDGHPANAHSVLTEHFVESAAHEVINFLQHRLKESPSTT